MTHIRHTMDVYGSQLRLAWDKPTYLAMRRENPDLGTLTEARAAAGFVTDSYERETGNQVIWIFINMERVAHEGDLWNTVAHEGFHVTEAVLGAMHVPVEGEPAAYLMGWVVNWIWAMIPREDKPWARPAA